MVVAAAAIFFALVHPLAADPIGVGKVERLADAVAPAPWFLPAFAPQLSHHPAVSPAPQMLLMSLDVTGLTCVLIC